MTQPFPAPLLVANKALDEINAIAATYQPPDKFTHGRLEQVPNQSPHLSVRFGRSRAA